MSSYLGLIPVIHLMCCFMGMPTVSPRDKKVRVVMGNNTGRMANGRFRCHRFNNVRAQYIGDTLSFDDSECESIGSVGETAAA